MTFNVLITFVPGFILLFLASQLMETDREVALILTGMSLLVFALGSATSAIVNAIRMQR